jgi:hypothetical protein
MSRRSRKRLHGALEEAEEDDAHLTNLFLILLPHDIPPEPRLLQLDSITLNEFLRLSDEPAWNKYVRFSSTVFSSILARVTQLYEHTPLRLDENVAASASRRALTTEKALLITLRYLASGFEYSDGALLAGVSVASLSRVIASMLPCLVVVLRHWPLAQVGTPSVAYAQQLSRDLVGHAGPAFQNFIGFVDGCVNTQENSTDRNTQNVHWNGKHFKAATKDLFLFWVDGCVGGAVINGAGSWHDAKLEFYLQVDTAFQSTTRKIRGLREQELRNLNAAQRSAALTAHALLAKIRVAAEWGIGGIHKCWRVLNHPLPSDDPIRRSLLGEACIRLWNLRCRTMGISQIRTVFTQ